LITDEPGFRSCNRQKARGAILTQRSRRVSASEQLSISGASRDGFKPYRNDVPERKMTLKLSQSDAFAAPGFYLASGIFDFDCGIWDEEL
jgi:hypothetical protein